MSREVSKIAYTTRDKAAFAGFFEVLQPGVAKCLLGERSLQFFRFRGPRCVGQRDLYPFAILFRELPVERHEELIRRAMRWPDPLAEQVARVVRR
jgi:hypothetical protein